MHRNTLEGKVIGKSPKSILPLAGIGRLDEPDGYDPAIIRASKPSFAM